MFTDKVCEFKCDFPLVGGIRIISMQIFCDLYVRPELYMQIMQNHVLLYKPKFSSYHRIIFILGR